LGILTFEGSFVVSAETVRCSKVLMSNFQSTLRRPAAPLDVRW
jgi:hypothetical protein